MTIVAVVMGDGQFYLDKIVDAQLLAEQEGNVEAIVAEMVDAVEFEAVGPWSGSANGRDAVRKYYQAWVVAVLPERVVRIRRIHGPGLVVDESLWEGRVIGAVGGVAGLGRRVRNRVLRVVEVEGGRIVREVVWRDLADLQRQLS